MKSSTELNTLSRSPERALDYATFFTKPCQPCQSSQNVSQHG